MTLPERDLFAAILTRRPLDLDTLLGEIAGAWDSDGAVLMTLVPGESVLQVTASFPASPPEAAAALRLPIGYGVTGRVAVNGQGVVLDHDSPRDPLHCAVMGLAVGDEVARLCLPLTGPGGTVGVLGLHRSPERPYGLDALSSATLLAAALGLRLEAELLGEQARASTAQRDELIAHATSAQEAERRRIAGDLHDGVTQALVSLDYHLSAASALLDAGAPAEAARQIEAARALSGLAYDETRAAISGLHSLVLDDFGLVAALESLAQTVSAASGTVVTFHSDPDAALDELPDHVAAALYRIAQEATSNAIKHAAASRVAVSLRRVGGAVVLAVSDDGVGFDAQKIRARSLTKGDAEHYGLSSIAERCALVGASLRIDSVEGRGTAVIVELDG